MSEQRTDNDSEQGMREISDEDHDQLDEEVDDEEFQPGLGEPLEDQNIRLSEEGNLGGNGVEATPIPSETTARGAIVVLGVQEHTEVPGSVNPIANEAEENGSADEKTIGKESKEEHLENGSKLIKTDVKEVHAGEKQYDETPVEKEKAGGDHPQPVEGSAHSFNFDLFLEGDDDGTEEEQAAFMRELENFHREKCLEFEPPKFYGEGLNCLKLWRAVT